MNIKFKKMKRSLFFTIVLIILLAACADTDFGVQKEKELVLPDYPYIYDKLALPINADVNTNIISDIKIGPDGSVTFIPININITNWGATLGRVLFYDTKLSLNNTISCGSCHHQDKSFADGQRFSQGFEGRITERNSMAIVNPITQNNLFWDSRSKNIHDLSLKPVQNHIEMGMENLDRLVDKLQNTPYYENLFINAFGDDNVTKERISNALSQFVGSITSNNSKFDLGVINGFTNFTELEKIGRSLFMSDRAKCSSCHGAGNFAALDGPNDPYGGGGSFGFESPTEDLRGATNIGLDLVYKDQGVGDGKFRIPSLRNIELTGPYMHDGRFSTLEEVINHYSEGIKPHAQLDVKFTDGKGNVKPLNLSSIEKKALIAFLKTLTDQSMTKDPKWSDPFH